MGKKGLPVVEEKRELLHRFMEDKILRGAAKAFGRSGYQGARLEEIAKETGVAVGTIYQYFENKYDLYIRVLNFFLDSLMETAREAIQGSDEPQERLEKVITRHIEFFEDNPDLFRIYLTGKHEWIIDPIDEPKAKVLERYTRYMHILSEALDELMRSRALEKVNSEKVAYYMLELAYSAVFQRVSGHSKETREEDTRIILDLLMDGIRKRKRGKTKGR